MHKCADRHSLDTFGSGNRYGFAIVSIAPVTAETARSQLGMRRTRPALPISPGVVGDDLHAYQYVRIGGRDSCHAERRSGVQEDLRLQSVEQRTGCNLD